MELSNKLKKKGFVICKGCGQIVKKDIKSCKWCYKDIKTGKKLEVKKTKKED